MKSFSVEKKHCPLQLLHMEAVPGLHGGGGGDAEVEVVRPPVQEVENVRPWPAVELGFDSLRVSVGRQLLAVVLTHQEQCKVLGVGDL